MYRRLFGLRLACKQTPRGQQFLNLVHHMMMTNEHLCNHSTQALNGYNAEIYHVDCSCYTIAPAYAVYSTLQSDEPRHAVN